MECNKDEALRSKSIAEAKFLEHDFSGARKFALKARQLFPELEGITQFISVLDVHAAARTKTLSIEADWYSILQVDPSSDENAIRKQYRKLVLLLHPDKNKSVGAEAAFKHVSEAWGVLSDRVKRTAFDSRRNAQSSQIVKAPQPRASNTHTFHNVPRPFSARQPQVSMPHAAQPQRQPPPPVAPPTFWTACPICRLQLEYQRVHIHKNLCCPVCRKPFFACEINCVGGTLLWPQPEKQCLRVDAQVNGFHVGSPFSGTKLSSPPAADVYASKATCVPQSDGTKEGKTLEDKMQKTTEQKEHLGGQEFLGKDQLRDTSTVNPNNNLSYAKNLPENNGKSKVEKPVEIQLQKAREQNKSLKGQVLIAEEQVRTKEAAHAKAAFDRLIARSKGVTEKSEDKGKVAADHIIRDEQFVPLDKGKKVAADDANDQQYAESENGNTLGKPSSMASGSGQGKGDIVLQEAEIAYKSNFSGAANSPLSDSTIPRGKRIMATVGNVSQTDTILAKKARRDAETISNEESKKELIGSPQALKSGEERMDTLFMDADKNAQSIANGVCATDTHVDACNISFYDFKNDRAECVFSPGQIWAAYDKDEGMPRYYARISKVASLQPFRVYLSWLEAHSPSDEILAWLDSGFSYTCGEFKLGKAAIIEHANTFSHLMVSCTAQKGVYKIYPRQGEVWALYGNWDNLLLLIGKRGYQLVEILTDFKEEVGVQVTELVKVDGYKTIFQKRKGEGCVQWIGPQQLRRFSHQVPAHQFRPDQDSVKLEGSWELDPAAAPKDLIAGKLLG